MTSISWNKIRQINGSQPNGFEELCCQLAHRETVPEDSHFSRKGTPDGGVEGFWTLQSQDEWGWQAKFFLGPMEKAQWEQLDDSVATAIEKHPKLTKLFICFPYNLPDSRSGRGKSALEKWDDRVEKWLGWAATAGMNLEFSRWDDHELLQRLSKEENLGLIRFWFDEASFSEKWFSEAVEAEILQARGKYSRKLDVRTPSVEKFDGLFFNKTFQRRINELSQRIGSVSTKLPIVSVPKGEEFLDGVSFLQNTFLNMNPDRVHFVNQAETLRRAAELSSYAYSSLQNCQFAVKVYQVIALQNVPPLRRKMLWMSHGKSTQDGHTESNTGSQGSGLVRS